jgi:opacity protein-like surface antigen
VRRVMAVLAMGLAGFGSAAPAQAGGGLDIRLGAYFPSANSDLFQDVTSLFTRGAVSGTATPPGISQSDWTGFTGGIEYNHKIAKNVEVAVHFDGYGKSLDTSYRDFTRSDGSPILQTLKLDVVPMGVSLRIVPTSRRAKVAPYLAAGVDLVYWNYQEYGDFIDFYSADKAVSTDSFQASGTSFGWHAAGGLRIAINDDVAFVAEARYLWSSANMGQDFPQNKIDLGGLFVTGGVHIRF